MNAKCVYNAKRLYYSNLTEYLFDFVNPFTDGHSLCTVFGKNKKLTSEMNLHIMDRINYLKLIIKHSAWNWKDISKVYCDCLDFGYRLNYALNKNKLATWKQPKKYENDKVFVNNQEPAVVTNPDNKVYVCKHLAKVLQDRFKK